MTTLKSIVPCSILNFVGSLFCGFLAPLIKFQQLYATIRCSIDMQKDLNGCKVPFFHTKIGEAEIQYSEYFKYCREHQGLLTGRDIDIVLEKLGMRSCWEESMSQNEGKCRSCQLLEGASVLMEEKEASMDELKEAFSVFDENEDGYIDASEVHRVLCRLEFKEAVKLEDSEKMIKAHDLNKDGRIDLFEFRKMLENIK